MTRVGASQAFFNIVASFNANKLIKDINSLDTIMKAVAIDTFEAMLKPFDEFGQMINQAREAVEGLAIEVGSARIEFEKFYGDASSIDRVADSVIILGESFAMTATESLAAASRAAQVANIVGQANVDLLVKQAMVLAEISDLNVEESQRALIKLQSQANILYGDYTEAQVRGLPLEMQRAVLLENSTAALDALNTIANRSVALEGDLVQTMTNFASQGHLVGESFEFMAAASATLLEAGEEQGTAGRALRMMYARLGGNISGAADQIEALGIQVRDSNGDILTMQEVLGNVSEKGWDTMSSSLKMNIAQTISGNRHYVRFIKLMDNYQRTLMLAEEGQQGLDSAVGQANRALAKQSKQLEITQARLENVKAEIGGGLTPAFIGSNRVMIDYLETVDRLTSGNDILMKGLGRLAGSLKVTGGFVKFGLALQSVGVGFGMYESVMKSLHGIEVANASLHSKQANYMEYGVQVARKRKYILEGMQYTQQAINASAEQTRMRQGVLNPILERRKQLLQDMTPLEEQVNMSLTKRANLSQKITSFKVMQKDLDKENLTSLQHKMAYLDHDARTGGDLLEQQKALYSQKTFAEEAYKRQYVADVTLMNSLDGETIKVAEENNVKLRERHSIFQDMMAANNAARAVRDEDDRGTIQTDAIKLANAEEFQKYLDKESVLVKGQLAIYKDKTTEQHKFYDARRKGLEQIEVQFKNLKDGKFTVGTGGLMKEGFNELERSMQGIGGHIIQIDRVLQAHNANLIKNGTITRRIGILESIKGRHVKELVADQTQLNQLMAEDSMLEAKMVPLLTQINALDGDKIEQQKVFLQLSELLTNTKKKDIALQEKFSKGQQQLDDESNKRRQMSMQQFGFAASSMISILGGMRGGTFGVAASMSAMGTQMMFATGQIIKSTKSLVNESAEVAKSAGLFNNMADAKAHFYKKIKIGMGVMAVAAIGIALYDNHMKKLRKTIDDTNKRVEELNHLFAAMQADTKLFGTEDELAEHFGHANYELHELYNNTDLAAQVMNDLENNAGGLDSAMLSVVENAQRMLDTLGAIQNQNTMLNPSLIRDAERDIEDAFGSGDNFWDNALLGYGDDKSKVKLAKILGVDTIGGSYFGGLINNETAFAEDLVDAYVKALKEGREFTDKERDLLEESLGDNAWASSVLASVNEIDRLTMSMEMLALSEAKVGQELVTTTLSADEQADEIKNLTDEIYNFSNAREELFFGGKYGNVTGSLYKQVVQQGVGVLYNKQEVIVSNVFHGFFNEKEAGDRISRHVEQVLNNLN